MKPFIAPEYQESLKIIGKKYVILRYRISPEFSTFDGHSPIAEIYRPGSICSIGGPADSRTGTLKVQV